MKKLDERFWSKVAKADCWNWTSNRNNKGYGLFKVSAVVGNQLAHRLSYEHHFGPIPPGGLVLHACDNPLCVNPQHLRVGSHKENVADMDARGRRNTPALQGADNPGSFMSEESVIALRVDYCAGLSNSELAAKYGVQVQSVGDYTSGRSWSYLLGRNGSPTLADLRATAEKNKKPGAILTAELVRDIRSELANGALGIELAAKYRVHKATISDIKRRKIWADV